MDARGKTLALVASILAALGTGYGVRVLARGECSTRSRVAEWLPAEEPRTWAEPAGPSVLSPTPAPPPAPVEERIPTPMPSEIAPAPDAAAARVAALGALRARLRDMLAEMPENWARAIPVLDSVKEIGTPEAIGLILETMECFEFDYPHRAHVFAELLVDVEDPRIANSARRILQRHLSEGLDSWYHTRGYIDLIASHLDAAGARDLLELMRTESQASDRACEHVGKVLTFVDLNEVLQILSSKPAPIYLFRGLASLEDPSIDREIARIAEQDPRLRMSLELAQSLRTETDG